MCKGFLFLLLMHSTIHWSQNITGKVVDCENNPLEFAAVAVIDSADSTLISYTSTGKFGTFTLSEISEGKSIFQVHLIGFKTYQTIIDFQNKSIDMTSIKLEDINILDEVVVLAEVPISIKKDTITYLVKAFKVRFDDTVEDLLKKLPGIEVDAKGKITAQGEEVEIVYVDGKNFFNGDPSIATKNLSADAIKKVEIIDEKSEKARITGLNDSEHKKVINLELNAANKVNAFGKFHGGYGSDNHYLTSLNYNRFSPKLQLSVIGNYNNVNSLGSDISGRMAFGEREMVSSGNEGLNSGFLTTGVGGLNLDYELKNAENLKANYFYNYTKVTSGKEVTKRTEFIDDHEIHSESKNRNESTSNNHSVNFGFVNRSNKGSALHLGGRINKNIEKGNNVNSFDKYNMINELDLQSIGITNTERTTSYGNVSIHYIKRFNEKSKRNFSISAKLNSFTNNSVITNNQLSKFDISNPDNFLESKQEVKRVNDNNKKDVGFDFNYTEPLAGHHFLEFRANYSYETTDEKIDQTKNENDIVQLPLLYTVYYNITRKRGGLFYIYNAEKFTFSTGVIAVDQTSNLGIENKDEFKNRYTNFNPEINISYRSRRGKFMNLNLRKSNSIPQLLKVFPVRNDYDPLFITIGNPLLAPEGNYSASCSYVNHNFITGFDFFSRLSYNFTKNSIVNSQFTNALGIRTTTYVNSDHRDSFYINLNIGKRVKSLGLRFHLLLIGGYRNYLSIINNKTNESESKNGTFRISFENNKKEKIDASVGASWNVNCTTFTAGNNASRDYLEQSYFAKIDWNITDRLNVYNQFNYSLYTDSNFGTEKSIPTWNASISYALLKSKRMNVMLSVFDVLNKNIGIEMNSSDNYFEESHKELLGKYYLVSLIYNLI